MPLKATGFVCRADGCNKAGYGPQNLCEKHRARLRRYGDPNAAYINAAPGHNKGKVCTIEGCERPMYGRGLCKMHHTRKFRTGDAGEAQLRRGKFGEGSVNQDGYLGIMINYKQKLMHRIIAERALGKPLPRGSIVHHLNGVRTDNRSCNLVVCPDESYHKLLHRRQRELGYNGPVPLEAESIHSEAVGQRSESSLSTGEE